jgi:hypothetical protein
MGELRAADPAQACRSPAGPVLNTRAALVDHLVAASVAALPR